jgi:hypothetical protein
VIDFARYVPWASMAVPEMKAYRTEYYKQPLQITAGT